MVCVTMIAAVNVAQASGNASANGRITREFLVPILKINALPALLSNLNMYAIKCDTNGVMIKTKIYWNHTYNHTEFIVYFTDLRNYYYK